MIKFFNLPRDITSFIKQERENFDYDTVRAEFDTALKASGIVSARLLDVTSKMNNKENLLSLADLSGYANYMNDLAIKDLETVGLPGGLSKIFVAHESQDGKIQQQMAINDFLPELSRYLVFLDLKKSILSTVQKTATINREMKSLNKDTDKKEIAEMHKKVMEFNSVEKYLTNTIDSMLSPSKFNDFCKNRFHIFQIEVKSNEKSPKLRS